MTVEPSKIVQLVVEIVTAYVAQNARPSSQVPELIRTVYSSLSVLGIDHGHGQVHAHDYQHQEPAVPVKRSVKADHIVCLEDGRKFKTLKRHLIDTHGMTPQEYRTKWGLADDYPMIAPNYSKVRSEHARKIGLGRAAGEGKAG